MCQHTSSSIIGGQFGCVRWLNHVASIGMAPLTMQRWHDLVHMLLLCADTVANYLVLLGSVIACFVCRWLSVRGVGLWAFSRVACICTVQPYACNIRPALPICMLQHGKHGMVYGCMFGLLLSGMVESVYYHAVLLMIRASCTAANYTAWCCLCVKDLFAHVGSELDPRDLACASGS